MELKLASGATISGTEEEVRRLARALGYGHLVPNDNDGVHYRSSTHGLMKIKDMNTRHVINALLKLYRAEVDALPRTRDELCLALRKGVVQHNRTLHALVDELYTRRD